MTDPNTDRSEQTGPEARGTPEQPDVDGELQRGTEANDLEADNPVEEATIEAVEPGNEPA